MTNVILIRTITVEDIAQFYEFSHYIFHNLNLYTVDLPEEFSNSIELEKQCIEKYNQPGNLIIGAFYENKLIGILDFMSNKRKRLKHWGKFGISIHHDYQDKGIGTKLMQYLLDWAKQNEQTKMICLSVHANNLRAIALYKKMGFKEFGYLKNCIEDTDGSFTDSIEMVYAL